VGTSASLLEIVVASTATRWRDVALLCVIIGACLFVSYFFVDRSATTTIARPAAAQTHLMH
jgi:hypothetical protein